MRYPNRPPTPEQRFAARQSGGRRPVMYQTWRNLLFLHRKCDADSLQSMLPPGLTVDVYQDEAYVGIVPFFMCAVRPRLLPCAPFLSNFLELNIRTYVHDSEGIPGVWFFSLDANCAPAVWAGRTFFKLPYRHAKMSASVADDGWVDYASRCGAGGYSSEYRYRAAGESREADPGSLEYFLLERYYLYASDQKRSALYRGQVAHTPYRYSDAEVIAEFGVEPMTKQGLLPPDIDDEGSWDHACVARDVEVRILGLERL